MPKAVRLVTTRSRRQAEKTPLPSELGTEPGVPGSCPFQLCSPLQTLQSKAWAPPSFFTAAIQNAAASTVASSQQAPAVHSPFLCRHEVSAGLKAAHVVPVSCLWVEVCSCAAVTRLMGGRELCAEGRPGFLLSL